MPGGVRLSGGPALSEPEISTWESEASSVIDIGDRCVPSESEDELADKQKYRLPDPGKTRLDLLTKEPLSSSRRPVPRASSSAEQKMQSPPTPTTQRASLLRHPSSPQVYRTRMNSSDQVNALSDSDHFPSDISRAGSIYSLSRVSFAGQIARLTSIKLPDAASLVKRISSIPTATEAARTLSDASEQINLWIGKASEVLQGLSAEDDVEWAAAGGRDGVDEADQAIERFDKLVDVYVLSIERLQTRGDVAMLSAAELTGSVKQMEAIITSWTSIKSRVKEIRFQVQLAIDWETLWNTDLGEIAQDMSQLSQHIFELEEKRHQGSEQLFMSSDGLDLHELESILEEQPKDVGTARLTPSQTPLPRLNSMIENAESYTLGLSARMQPLRTALDFLPMKLSTYHIRAHTVFPTACRELQDRRDELEDQWRKIEQDAKALRDELGDDKWVTVFRNAGTQANKICDSVERTLIKLKAALDANEQVLNRNATLRKIESFEAKKLAYTPAIDRVLGIIERGVRDRLTINGDVLRLKAQLQQRWMDLRSRMKAMDILVAQINMDKNDQRLRDSVSTILSSEKSMLSNLLDTPGTSPASSVVGASRKSSFHGARTPTQGSMQTPSTAGKTSDRRLSSSVTRRSGLFNRKSVADFRNSPSPASNVSISTQWPARSHPKEDIKPKWNASTRSDKRDFAPLSKFEPSPYAKRTQATRPGAQQQPSTSRVVSEPVKHPQLAADDRNRRRSVLPVPQTPDRRANSALSHDRSSLKPQVTPLPTTGRRSRLSAVFATTSDGNDADIDAPARSLQRPLSSLDKVTRRNNAVPNRSRLDADQIGPGIEKPKWR